MHTVYQSDQFVVVQIDVPAAGGDAGHDAGAPRGGYEIVDRLARREIFIDGLLAEAFRRGVQALAADEPSVEAFDEYIARFGALAQQPLVMH